MEEHLAARPPNAVQAEDELGSNHRRLTFATNMSNLVLRQSQIRIMSGGVTLLDCRGHLPSQLPCRCDLLQYES